MTSQSHLQAWQQRGSKSAEKAGLREKQENAIDSLKKQTETMKPDSVTHKHTEYPHANSVLMRLATLPEDFLEGSPPYVLTMDSSVIL